MCLALGACCCITSACTCCCKIPCKGSQVSRILYTLGLFFATAVAWALRNWGDRFMPEAWQKCNGTCFNYIAVYRISLGFVLYHLALCLFTIGVTTSKYPRAMFHNGFWPIKFLMLGGLIAACFFIPDSFFQYYAYIAVVGGIIFLLFQTIIILGFAHDWAESWVRHWEEEDDPCWRALLIGVTLISYLLVVGGTIVLYVFFAKGPYIGINVFFITFNLIVVILASIMSVLPAVQEANPKSGLLQAALIGAYMTYVVASSLASEPKGGSDVCGPTGGDTFSQVLFYTGFATTFFALCISTFSASGSDDALSTSTSDGDIDDEKEQTAYNYSFMHLTFSLAGLYMAVLLTNWAIIEGTTFEGGEFCVDQGFGSVWAKAATSWVVGLLYIWTLIAPILLPDRFGND